MWVGAISPTLFFMEGDNMEKPFTYEIDPDFDYVLEERGNTYTAARKIRWGDRDHFSFDIRKWYATEEGERMAKGCSFMSDEGVDELARVLLSTGYGNDKELANEICSGARDELAARIYNRILEDKDLKDRVEDIIVNHLADEDEEEYHDLREVI